MGRIHPFRERKMRLLLPSTNNAGDDSPHPLVYLNNYQSVKTNLILKTSSNELQMPFIYSIIHVSDNIFLLTSDNSGGVFFFTHRVPTVRGPKGALPHRALCDG